MLQVQWMNIDLAGCVGFTHLSIGAELSIGALQRVGFVTLCSSAVAPSNECQWHGLCLLWQLTLKYFLPPERLQACTQRCQMQAHDPVSTDGPVGPCTPVRLVQVELSKGDARSPESSDSPPFQCNAMEPFRKREPPKLSWPRLTVNGVLLIQC